MPVQINEVIIRAVVDPNSTKKTSKQPECPPSGNSGSDADVVEKVLEIIKRKSER